MSVDKKKILALSAFNRLLIKIWIFHEVLPGTQRQNKSHQEKFCCIGKYSNCHEYLLLDIGMLQVLPMRSQTGMRTLLPGG